MALCALLTRSIQELSKIGHGDRSSDKPSIGFIQCVYDLASCC